MARITLIAFRRATAASWTSTNPTLASGEPGIETDTGKMKVGNGSTAWASLPYLPAGAATTLSPGRNIDGQAFDGSADITVIAPGTHAATSKATPVDADELPLVDSAASNVLKKLTWANLKATLFGTPAVVLGTAASAGTAATALRTDATIVAFDATSPSTQAFGDAAAVGTAAVAARRDHKHAMPSVATNALVLGTAAAAGSAATTLRSDDTIAAFDATVPSTQAMGDAAATGSAAVAARRDHKHAMPSFATNAVVLGSAAAAGAATTPMRSNDTIAAFDATAPVTQAFSDAAAVGTAAFAARRDHKHGMPASPAAPAGSTALVYRYTVAGSDKASIDTGADTADAGSNDWTNGDVLEVYILCRTDKVAVQDSVTITVNNDTSSIYDRMLLRGLNATASASNVLAGAGWINLNAPGASATAGWAAMFALTIPGYAGTTWKKIANMAAQYDDTTAANFNSSLWALGYGSTNALTRMAIAGQAGQKLKVGSMLLIYKRLAS